MFRFTLLRHPTLKRCYNAFFLSVFLKLFNDCVVRRTGLTRTTISFMCSNSSGWRKEVNSSLSAAASPSKSAFLNRLSSRGSIFLKLNWSVVSSNSSGLAGGQNGSVSHGCSRSAYCLKSRTHTGSIHTWLACTPPTRSCCPC